MGELYGGIRPRKFSRRWAFPLRATPSSEGCGLDQVVHQTHASPPHQRLAESLPRHSNRIQQKKETMMINLWKWTGICVAMALMFAVMSGVMVAQDAKI